MADNPIDPTAPSPRRSTLLGWRLINRRYLWLWFIALALPGYFGWCAIILVEALQGRQDLTEWLLLVFPVLGLTLFAGWGLALQRWLRPPPAARHLLQFAVGIYGIGTLVLLLYMVFGMLFDRWGLEDVAQVAGGFEGFFSLFLPLIYGAVTVMAAWRAWRRHLRREHQAIRVDEGLEPRRGAPPTDRRRAWVRRLDAWPWWRSMPVAALLPLPAWFLVFAIMADGDWETFFFFTCWFVAIAVLLLPWGLVLDRFTRRPPYAGSNFLLASAALALAMTGLMGVLCFFDWSGEFALIIPFVLVAGFTTLSALAAVTTSIWLITRTVILRFRDQRLELADIHEDTQSWQDLDH